MANKVYSAKKILADLNSDLPTAEWVEVSGIYILSEGKITDEKVVPSGDSLVMKCFINVRTTEIKTYLAKFLEDVEETSQLP